MNSVQFFGRAVAHAGLGLALVSVVNACSDDSESAQQCYERDAALDYEFPAMGLPLPPYCRWEVGELPEPPEGYAFTHKVFITFKATEDEPCDPCDVERFDALVEEQIRRECDQPYEFVRGCYVPAEETPNDTCWVAGLYFSNCEVAPAK